MSITRTSALLAVLVLAAGCDPGVGVRPRGPDGGGGAGGTLAQQIPPDGAGGELVVPEPELACEDGIDDDGDGAVDCADLDCTPDTLLAGDVHEPVAVRAEGAGNRSVFLYSATGTVGSKRRLHALPVDGVAPAGAPRIVYEGPRVDPVIVPRLLGGFAVVLGSPDTGRIELVQLNGSAEVQTRTVLAEDGEPRPLVSAVIDPETGAIVVMRGRDTLRMELAWFDQDGGVLAPWRDFNVLEFYTARLVVSGGKTWLVRLPNFTDDAIGGEILEILPANVQRRSLPAMRAHSTPLVPVDGEIVVHSQGVKVLGPGGSTDGPEFTRVQAGGRELARREVPQPMGTLRLASFVGAWEGGVAAVYPGVEDGKEALVVVRAPADLSSVDPPVPLLPGLPTVVHLESLPEEDRVFYVTEDGTQLRVRVTPRHCAP